MGNQYLAKSAHQPLELPSHEILSQLALNEPHEYESLRHDLIKKFIGSAPERIKSRLLGIQFRVDSMRRLSKSPLGLTVGIYRMMWECFLDLNQNWQEFVDIKNECIGARSSMKGTDSLPHKSAQVLEFRQRDANKSAIANNVKVDSDSTTS